MVTSPLAGAVPGGTATVTFTVSSVPPQTSQPISSAATRVRRSSPIDRTAALATAEDDHQQTDTNGTLTVTVSNVTVTDFPDAVTCDFNPASGQTVAVGDFHPTVDQSLAVTVTLE